MGAGPVGTGPVYLYPSATDDRLGSEKWGAGPTAVLLQQKHCWTYGALVNRIWSFAGNDDCVPVSATLRQPFLSHIVKTFTSFTVNTGSTYNWQSENWKVPLKFNVSELREDGKQPTSI